MVAVVVGPDVSEAIPLMNDNGSGVYIAGRNTASEIRRDLIGGLFGKSGNDAFAWRSGVICPGTHTSGAMVDFAGESTGGAGTQAVNVRAGRLVCFRTGQGVYLVSNAAFTAVAAPAADVSNPRIDILGVMPYDKGPFPADSVHGPKYVWVTGDPAGSPTVPAIPAAVQQMVPLLRVTRGVSDNTIDQASITDIRKSASIHGTPRHLLSGDLLADAGAYHGEKRIRSVGHIDSVYINAGYTLLEDRWDAVNNTWRGTQALHLPKPTLATTASLGGAATFTLATVSLPDPGWPYRVDVSGSILQAITGGATTDVKDVYLQFNVDSTSFTPPGADLIQRYGRPAGILSPLVLSLIGRRSAVLTGAHSVSFIIRNESIPSNFVTWNDNEYAHCNITVLPA